MTSKRNNMFWTGAITAGLLVGIPFAMPDSMRAESFEACFSDGRGCEYFSARSRDDGALIGEAYGLQ